MTKYSDQAKELINKTWFILERITDSNYRWENYIKQALKIETKNRKDSYNAKALIIRSIFKSNKIKKHELSSYSDGIVLAIIAGWDFLHIPLYYQIDKIKEFKQNAKLVIQEHDLYMEKLFNAITSKQ